MARNRVAAGRTKMNAAMEAPTRHPAVDHDIDGLADRLLKITLVINLAMPGLLFLCAYLLRSMEILPVGGLIPAETLQIVFFALLFVAVSEVAVAFVLKKMFFSPERVQPTLNDTDAFAKLVTGGSITLAALGAASMVYGVILFILGMDITRIALFALISMVHFRLFRPTSDFLRSVITQAS